jgi:hypothetical protein
MKDEHDARACFILHLHPSAFILSSNVREETFEYTDPQPYGAFHQCR